MLSYKNFILMLEDRVAFLKKQHLTIDTSHDRNAQHKDAGKIIDHFATHADPSQKKNYTQWIVNQYRKKNIRQEDHPRVKEALENFERHKAKLPKKDINQYKHVSEVEDAVEPHLGTAGSKKEEKRAIKHEGAELVHDDKELGVTVHKLKTKEAACHYGAGTKWCTAAKQNNMFKEYNTGGGIHVIQHKGRKYQFHNETSQMMDEKDRTIGMGVRTRETEKMHPDIAKSLAKSNYGPIKDANFLFGNHHFRPEEHVEHFAKHKNSDIAYQAAESYHEIAQHSINHPNKYVRSAAAKWPDLAEKLLKDPNPTVKFAVAQHEHLSHHFVNDESSEVRRKVTQHEHLAKKMLNDPSSSVRSFIALKHPHLAHHFVKDKDPAVRKKIAEEYPDLGHHFVNDKNHRVRAYAAAHEESAHHYVNDPHDYVREVVAGHTHLAHHFINDPSAHVRAAAAEHSNLSHHFVNDPDEMVRGTANLILKAKNRG